MKREPTDAELAGLLSGRSGPSVLDKEAAFEAVMAEQPRRRRFGWHAAIWPMTAVAAVAVALAVVVVPTEPAPSEFTPRGAADPGLTLSCVRKEAPAPCVPGATLLLDVRPKARPYFGAFARSPEGTIIWYLPAADQPTRKQDGLLSQGFELSGVHGGGTLEVFGVFTDRPMTRPQLKAALDDGLKSTDAVSVVRRSLTLSGEAR